MTKLQSQETILKNKDYNIQLAFTDHLQLKVCQRTTPNTELKIGQHLLENYENLQKLTDSKISYNE